MSRKVRRILLWSISPLLLASVLFVVGVLWPLPSETAIRAEQPLAFIGATIIDVGRGVPLPNRKSLVRERARSWTVGSKMLWRFVRSPVNY